MNKTKKIIFESAIKVFSNSGYDGATVDEIAIEAGVAKGTLYYHFKSKEEIFKFIISEGLNLMEEEIGNIDKDNLNPIDRLKDICKIQLALLNNNKAFFRVLMSQLWGQELRQLELRKQLVRYINRIEVHIAEAMEKGMIIKGNSRFMAYTFFGSLISAAVYEVTNDEKIGPDEIAENLILFNFKGLQKNI